MKTFKTFIAEDVGGLGGFDVGDNMKTWMFDITFTRPDEGDANVYTVGYNAYGRSVKDLASAEAWTRESFKHLTILKIKHIGTKDN